MYSQDQFDDYRESTIGAAFLTQTISLDDTTTVKFEIWDTAGQERYKSLAPMYYRNANCAVVVYDITQAVRPSTEITSHRDGTDSSTVFPRQSQSMGEGTPKASKRKYYYRTGREQGGPGGRSSRQTGHCYGGC